METLVNLESFVRSAETGGFSAAARRLGLTPAAVSRNVATLERNLGVRLFQRTTRKLTLTEAGERFLDVIGGHLEGLQAAIADVSEQSEPAGTLKVSMSVPLGIPFILPLLPAFRARYPHIRPDWQFDNRQIDLIADGFDAAIGANIELAPGVVTRTLAPAHIIAVASPGYMAQRPAPAEPEELAAFDGIIMRSAFTGRLRHWTMRNAAGAEQPEALGDTIILNEPGAMAGAAVLGLGVAMLATPDALPHLERGTLIRLLPEWYADAGPISLYYASRTLLPAKTRVFVDFVTDAFKRERLAERFSRNSAQCGRFHSA